MKDCLASFLIGLIRYDVASRNIEVRHSIAEVMERHGGRYDIRPAEGSPEGARSIQ